jgi:MFS transporter
MSTDTDSQHRSEAAAALPAPVRARIFSYLGFLAVFVAFGAPTGGLIEIPISFFLKNRLHLEAHEVAHFRLLAGFPLYLSFVFGFIRDSWNPFGMRDRGYMLSFGIATAALYVFFALQAVTYMTLLCAVILLTTCYLFVASAQNGLTSMIAQQHAMSGQVSAVWNIASSIPGIAALVIGGALSQDLEGRDGDQAARILFLVGAVSMVAIALYATWKPRVVFDNIRYDDAPRHMAQIKTLLRHWPIYPALLIWLLWNFAPGSSTPLQYYLQNSLHGDDAYWGQWNAVFGASFIPTFMLFGVLSPKYTLRTLLWAGTLVAIPQLVPLLFISSLSTALIGAMFSGLTGGVATAAYLGLIIRSCPPGFQGTTLMMSAGLSVISIRFGDVLGTALYDHFQGFTACVIATTIVYALILPALLLVPGDLIATADGEALPPARSEASQ